MTKSSNYYSKVNILALRRRDFLWKKQNFSLKINMKWHPQNNLNTPKKDSKVHKLKYREMRKWISLCEDKCHKDTKLKSKTRKNQCSMTLVIEAVNFVVIQITTSFRNFLASAPLYDTHKTFIIVSSSYVTKFLLSLSI